MNLDLFQQKLETLSRFPYVTSDEIETFKKILLSLEGWGFHRMNPLQLAEQHNLSAEALINCFIYATKIGLFDFNWNVICPRCGGVEHNYPDINEIKSQSVFCTTCQTDIPCSLDDQVEVSFNLNPGILDLSSVIDPYLNHRNHIRFFYSSNFVFSQEILAFLEQSLLSFNTVLPDQSHTLKLDLSPGEFYRLKSLETHSQCTFKVSNEVTQTHQVVNLDLLRNGFSPTELALKAGPIQCVVHNRTKQRLAYSAWSIDFPEMQRVFTVHPLSVLPYFTGKHLLTSQVFREQFRAQDLNHDLKLDIRSLTLLFTDLKGSTEMYELSGDFEAYQRVQEHFNLLIECVRHHRGSIVKTMGDAIMATFMTPLDGIQAALEMLKAVETLPQSPGALGLKIGLNEGPVLAVNADERLDYFGQAVNIAARVQGLAGAGEIWVTAPIEEALSDQNLLLEAGFSCQAQAANLKGVSQATQVYQYSIQSQTSPLKK